MDTLVIALKHLSGKHDQLSHSGSKGGKLVKSSNDRLLKSIKHLGSGHDQLSHSGGKGGALKPTSSKLTSHAKIKSRKEPVWQGKQQAKGSKKLSKLETGDIGEKVAMQALQDKLKVPFDTINIGINNAPIDVAGDHMAIEVKTGLASNGLSAQRWRATIGEPGKREKELLKKMDKDEKRAHNNWKKEKILERKNDMIKKMTKEAGEEIKPFTVANILSSDGKSIDVFMFPGFHLTASWKQFATEENRLGSFDIEG